MAIEYARTFSHTDWIDNEDVVQAEGENGFNVRFHALEDELDAIGTAIGEIRDTLGEGLKVEPVAGLAKNLGANEVTTPEQVDQYDNAEFPGGGRKLFQVVIEAFPPNHGQVSHHFLYEPVAGNQTRVSVWFKNELNQSTQINARVFALS